jgi:hypothetical protein
MSFDIKTSFKANLNPRNLFPGALSRLRAKREPEGLGLYRARRKDRLERPEALKENLGRGNHGLGRKGTRIQPRGCHGLRIKKI